jgi:hypothetical protein
VALTCSFLIAGQRFSRLEEGYGTAAAAVHGIMNLMGGHDREARRQAAREAVLQARLEAERPWWQKRSIAWLTAAPLRFWRGLKWWGSELGHDAYELLLTCAALVFVCTVGLLTSWAWRTAPIPTAVLIAGTVAFLAFGGMEFFRDRRRGRLAMIATAAFGFVALWVAVPLLSSWLYLLF